MSGDFLSSEGEEDIIGYPEEVDIVGYPEEDVLAENSACEHLDHADDAEFLANAPLFKLTLTSNINHSIHVLRNRL